MVAMARPLRIDCASVIAEFDSDAVKARRAYRRFVQAGMETPPDRWVRGRRVDDASRCIAAFEGRSFGHRAKDIAAAPGHAGASSVAQAVKRVEAGHSRLPDVIRAVERRVRHE